jgi:hypothetical protein
MPRFNSAEQRRQHDNGLRGAHALRNSSPGEITARHEAAVASEMRSKENASSHKVRELAKEAIREAKRES